MDGGILRGYPTADPSAHLGIEMQTGVVGCGCRAEDAGLASVLTEAAGFDFSLFLDEFRPSATCLRTAPATVSARTMETSSPVAHARVRIQMRAAFILTQLYSGGPKASTLWSFARPRCFTLCGMRQLL
jgi:hypothetical protein